MNGWPIDLRDTAQHLVRMHQIAGAREHAELRAAELAKQTGFETLPEVIRAVRREQAKEGA